MPTKTRKITETIASSIALLVIECAIGYLIANRLQDFVEIANNAHKNRISLLLALIMAALAIAEGYLIKWIWKKTPEAENHNGRRNNGQ